MIRHKHQDQVFAKNKNNIFKLLNVRSSDNAKNVNEINSICALRLMLLFMVQFTKSIIPGPDDLSLTAFALNEPVAILYLPGPRLRL